MAQALHAADTLHGWLKQTVAWLLQAPEEGLRVDLRGGCRRALRKAPCLMLVPLRHRTRLLAEGFEVTATTLL